MNDRCFDGEAKKPRAQGRLPRQGNPPDGAVVPCLRPNAPLAPQPRETYLYLPYWSLPGGNRVANAPRLAIESIAGQRPYQEDAVLAETLSDGRVLVAVADGMGGHAAGEVASALALETLVASLERGDGLDVAFAKANAEVHDKARDPGKNGMGTTLVAALVEDGEYMVANVGDSRGYVVSADGIRQITHDHSFAAEAARHGQPIAEEMAMRYKDALTRSIGTEGAVEVDVFGPFPVESGTALVICSDGLYKTLEDDQLHRIFVQSLGPEGAAQTLVAAAYDNGSDDNISVAIAEYGEVRRVTDQGTMPIDFEPPEESVVDSAPLAETPDEPHAPSEAVGDGEGATSGFDPDATAAGWTPISSASEVETADQAAARSADLPAPSPVEGDSRRGVFIAVVLVFLGVLTAILAF